MNSPYRLLIISAIVICLAIVGFLTIASYMMRGDPYPEDEVSAIRALAGLSQLQHKHASALQTARYSCDLAALKPTGFAETHYVFAIWNCRRDEQGRVTQYEITAVPERVAKGRRRAFCTDESALIWYDNDGSAEKCLMRKHSLQ